MSEEVAPPSVTPALPGAGLVVAGQLLADHLVKNRRLTVELVVTYQDETGPVENGALPELGAPTGASRLGLWGTGADDV